MKVMYMERDSFIGERVMDTAGITVSDTPYTACYPNTAYFCPVCGELWGRSIYSAIDFTYRPYVTDSSWIVETRRCVRHGDGTFLTGLPLDNCDKELLTRELLALLERN